MWIVAWLSVAVAADASFEWTALAGLQSTFGIPLTALGNPREPGTKVSVPVETSLGLVIGPGVLLRAHVGAGALLNGTYLYSTAAGELVGFPHHVDVLGSLGGRVETVSFGLQGGFSWPSRPTARAFVAWSPQPSPFVVEFRSGVQLPTDRAIEPTLQLLVGLTGPLRRQDD